MDIKLMNYGRGAGKSFTLAKWAREDRTHRVIIVKDFDRYTDAQPFGNILRYSDSNTVIVSRLMAGVYKMQVAFDDFDLLDPRHTELLATVAALTGSVKSVILATNLATLPTEATRELNEKFGMGAIPEGVDIREKLWPKEGRTPKPDGPTVEHLRSPETKKKDETTEKLGSVIYDELRRLGPNAAGDIGREFIRQHNEQGGITVSGTIKVTDESEPIQPVKVRDLRINDYIQHKGYVTAIGPSHYGHTHLQVTTKDSSPHFEGVLHGRVDTTLDVDTSKRR